MAQEETTTIDQLNEEADIAADYLEGLLDIADYEGDIEMGVRNGRPMTIRISSISLVAMVKWSMLCSSLPGLLFSRRPANARI